MKTASLILALGILGGTFASAAPDRTQYDCRETVAVKVRPTQSKPRVAKFIKQCPHKELIAAGKCETHWLRGMRCTE